MMTQVTNLNTNGKATIGLLLKTMMVLFLLYQVAPSLEAQTQTFNNPANNGTPANTFLIPAGVNKVSVHAWGGGGAGGGCSANNNNAAGGGGGGTYTLANGVVVTTPVDITVGAGGLGVSGANGNPGLPSIFNSSVPVSAVGGSFGLAAIGSSQSANGGAATNGITYDGGAGAAGVHASSGTSYGGAGGGGAGNGGDGGNAVAFTGGAGGIGAPAFGIAGGTGAAGTIPCSHGINATGIGAGGSGGHNTNNGGGCSTQVRIGGNGSNGQVVVRYIVISAGTLAACFETNQAAIDAAVAATTVSDHCDGNITKVGTISGGPCNAIVTVTATNDCGNESVVTYTVNVNPPAIVFTCGEDVTLPACSTQAEVEAAWQDFLASTTASGGCNGGLTHNAPSTTPSYCGASVDVTWTYASDCDEEDFTCTATFTVEEATPPVLVDPAEDETVECDGAGNTAALQAWLDSHGGAIVTSGCPVTWDDNFEGLTDDCGATGSATVTFTVSDDCGNVISTTATFTIEDTTDPVWTVTPADETVECDGFGNTAAFEAWLEDSFYGTDECGGAVMTHNYGTEVFLSDGCGETGTVTVTFTLTDDCGNAISTNATFTIEDTTDPEWTNDPDDLTVECDGAGNLAELNNWLNNTFAGEDVCGDAVVTHNYGSGPGQVLISDDCGATGSVTVTFTLTDECENFITQTATFRIEDTTDPEWTVAPSNLTVECDGFGNLAELNAWLNETFYGDDVCGDASMTHNYGDGPGEVLISDDCGATGTVTVTFTLTDECGNDITETATFTIEDTTDPEWTVAPSDLTVECDGFGNLAELNAWLNETFYGDDICGDATMTHNYGDGPGEVLISDDCGATGTVTVTFTLTDECGNDISNTATFTIEDTTDPEWTVAPSDLTVECDGFGNLAELDAWLNETFYGDDICGDAAMTHNYGDGPGEVLISDDCGATGTVTVTFTLTDECGNDISNTATFTIEDTTDPEWTVAPSDLTVECDGFGNIEEFETWLEDSFYGDDVCGDATMTHNYGTEVFISDDCGATGTVTVTFTLTDECGNDITNGATFTIEDTTDPEWTVTPSDLTVECDGFGNVAAFETWLEDSFYGDDVCGDATMSHNYGTEVFLSDDCGATGTVTVTFTLTDECGNDITNAATFTIEDTTDPAWIVEPSDLTVECDGFGNVDAFDTWLEDSFYGEDVCGDATMSHNYGTEVFLSDDCGATGTVTVTFTLTDECGNDITADATFTIVDTTDPEWTNEPADLTVECDGSGNTAEFDEWLNGVAGTDACGSVIVTHNYDEGNLLSDDCGATGTVTVVFTLTDDCENSITAEATFTIEDTTDPYWIVAPEDRTVDCNGQGDYTAEIEAWLDEIEGADDCAQITLAHNYGEVAFSDGCGETGSVTVTFTLTDECLNSITAEATFTVQDTTPPTALCQDVTITWDENAEGSITIEDVDAGSFDECGDVTLALDQTEFDCSNFPNAIVTLTVTDECNNTSTCTANVTILVPGFAVCGNNNDKIYMCHLPPGNPPNYETICINPISVCDHLGHGDYMGPCEQSEELFQHATNSVGLVSNDEPVKLENKMANFEGSVDFVHSHPNPFDGQATIHVGLAKSENVSLRVFNQLGQLVTVLYEGNLESGDHAFIFDGAGLPEGIYVYTLNAGKEIRNGRMMLAK